MTVSRQAESALAEAQVALDALVARIPVNASAWIVEYDTVAAVLTIRETTDDWREHYEDWREREGRAWLLRDAVTFEAGYDAALSVLREHSEASAGHWVASTRPIEPPDYRRPVIAPAAGAEGETT